MMVDARSEEVIGHGLGYLAAQQATNGSWQGTTEQERRYPIAMTSYALMAFLACGHLPDEGEYGRHVARGARFLLDSIDDEGLIGDRESGQYLYFHGIATMVLAELYGQDRSDDLRAQLERLVRIIVASQSPEGGWRYRPVAIDADISVTVVQVAALRAAINAGLEVPRSTIDDAVAYVRSCHHETSGGFSYQPGEEPGFARTAAAIYALQVCGEYDDPRIARGSRFLFDHFGDHRWFTYGNFYAAPAQLMIGGETWATWFPLIREALLKRARPVGDAATWNGDVTLGPVYETAVNVTILAMPYQLLPLYQR